MALKDYINLDAYTEEGKKEITNSAIHMQSLLRDLPQDDREFLYEFCNDHASEFFITLRTTAIGAWFTDDEDSAPANLNKLNISNTSDSTSTALGRWGYIQKSIAELKNEFGAVTYENSQYCLLCHLKQAKIKRHTLAIAWAIKITSTGVQDGDDVYIVAWETATGCEQGDSYKVTSNPDLVREWKPLISKSNSVNKGTVTRGDMGNFDYGSLVKMIVDSKERSKDCLNYALFSCEITPEEFSKLEAMI